MDDLLFLDSVKKMPLMVLPVRSTLVRLRKGSVLISPGSKLALDQLKNLNVVTDIVAPNLFHCAGVSKANSVFPNAKTWVSPGGKELKPKVIWGDELSLDLWPYQDELPMILLKGMSKVNELIFYHRKSKSLIVADFCFNLLDVEGLGARIILSLFGSYKKFAISRFFIRFIDDKVEFEKSLVELFSFDFENIIVGHGKNVIGDAKNKLLVALSSRGLAPK